MKSLFYLIMTGSILLSCKATKKEADSLVVSHAWWYNWSGGIAGVGGTNYEIGVTGLKAGTEIIFEKLLLDGVEVPIDQVEYTGGTHLLYASENKSNRNDVVGRESISRPDFRRENPENALVKGTINGEPFELRIDIFEQTEMKNRQ